MILRWYHHCYLCKNPIDLHIYANFIEEYILFDEFWDVHPLHYLHLNDLFLKKIGSRMRRVCRTCFDWKPMMNPRDRRLVQIGVKKERKPDGLSLRKDELEKWFELMKKFYARNMHRYTPIEYLE